MSTSPFAVLPVLNNVQHKYDTDIWTFLCGLQQPLPCSLHRCLEDVSFCSISRILVRFFLLLKTQNYTQTNMISRPDE
ncbi:hypothetical protein SISSUDRAFT_432770 [Sistotremastrum suecicum HHB10207 ss-3]|uniref:Uncharacterized protein n=1 Tax=Sistotremastrum suecicum HHB10207 ss-3 TaxID=1314776 RepID=A0A165YGP2_9AGAM|nr:hypothetical protein SISSUDRAFT_432770 [Sistotremastrum suecicum HHB10207 ss-3]